VQQTLSRMTIGPRQGDGLLAMYPLLDATAPVAAHYVLARDAFTAGTLVVSEITESGPRWALRHCSGRGSIWAGQALPWSR